MKTIPASLNATIKKTVTLKTTPLVFCLKGDGVEIKIRTCQRRVTQVLLDVYIANMISYDSHWRSLQFLQAHDLRLKTVLSA